MSDTAHHADPAYDRRTRQLHWAVGGLVVVLWLMAQGNSFLPKGPLRLSIWSVHVLLGFLLAALVVARIAWRVSRGDRLPPVRAGLWGHAASAVHYLLYLLLVAVVVLGIMNVFGHGFPLFGVWKFPRFWEKPFQHRIADWHGLAANVIAGVAVIHAIAALWHHHVLRDGTLRRMWPARSGASNPPGSGL
jgi:cytochrome b561